MDIADNDTIVGFDVLLGNRRGWIQPEGQGPLMELKSYFESNGASVPQGLVLEVPQAISADGHFIVGHGFGTGAWIATLIDDCDFDGDLACDVGDIDALVDAIVNQSTDPLYDLTGDGTVWTWPTAMPGSLRPERSTCRRATPICSATSTWMAVSTALISLLGMPTSFRAPGLGPPVTSTRMVLPMALDFVLWNANKFQSADLASVPEPGWLPLLIGGLACHGTSNRNPCDAGRGEWKGVTIMVRSTIFDMFHSRKGVDQRVAMGNQLLGVDWPAGHQAAWAERVSFAFIEGAASANDMSPDGRFIVGASRRGWERCGRWQLSAWTG